MEIISVKCPQCGANLNLHYMQGQTTAFCEYCGGRIILNNDTKACDVNNGVFIQESEPATTESDRSSNRDSISISFFKRRVLLYVAITVLGVVLDSIFPDKELFLLWTIGLIFVIYGSIGHGIALFLAARKKKRTYQINNTTVINNQTGQGNSYTNLNSEALNYCHNCGAKLVARANFCNNCGQKVQ